MLVSGICCRSEMVKQSRRELQLSHMWSKLQGGLEPRLHRHVGSGPRQRIHSQLTGFTAALTLMYTLKSLGFEDEDEAL